jgi:hypothetical protein
VAAISWWNSSYKNGSEKITRGIKPMKNRLIKNLSLVLAGTLQLMPLVRSMLPTVAQRLLPSGGAILFRWAAGGAAMFGYHAISSASSIAISPANATVGQPYVGTVTYSGGHAGSVQSMSYIGICLTTAVPFAPGLTVKYNGGNTATVTGTPTAATNFNFTLRMTDGPCGGGANSDTRSTLLVIGSSGGGGVVPSFSTPPQSITAQESADALLSAAAAGSPPPNYYWKQGLTPIPGATNSTLSFSSVQLTNAGLYTVTASNASGTASATCYLSVCITPGTNQLALNYTNYALAGQALTMYSYITNAPAGSNTYKWQYNLVDITTYTTNGNTLALKTNQVTPSKSGVYSVVFDSSVGANVVVNQQAYYSYWAFGTAPAITTSPASTNVNAGATVTLSGTANIAGTPYGNSQPVHFDWFLNNTTLVGSQDLIGTNQTSTLTLNNVSAANAGSYTLVATDYWGSVTSAPAIVSMGSTATAPAIMSEPVPQSALVGHNASFSVTASGTPPLSYGWQKDGADLSNGAVYSGVNSNMLTLIGVQTGNAGNYSVIITNSVGSTNSTTAALTVSAPPALIPSVTSAGGFQLSATTIPGIPYVVQSSFSLATPVTWNSLGTNVTPPSGVLIFTNSLSGSGEFFRILFP